MTRRLFVLATTVGAVVVLWVAPAAAGVRNI
jgi:hypothetical protein